MADDRPSFWKVLKEAFNARPIGMFIPPNWIGLAGVALVGTLVHPGFLLIGAGLELAYLFGLSSSSRFQRYVRGKDLAKERGDWQQQLDRLLGQLEVEERDRYWRLHDRAQSIIAQQRQAGAGGALSPSNGHSPELAIQGEGLARLLWIYLKLLHARHSIKRVITESLDVERRREPLDRRKVRLERELEREELDEDLRKSLEGQVDILRQRLEKRAETREKLAYLDAELTRIEDQVELIREQAVIASEPHAVSERIDQIAATLGGTQQWIRDQRSILGPLDEMLTEPPPLMSGAARESE